VLEQNSPHSVDSKSNHGGDWHLGLVSRSRARAQAGGLAEADLGAIANKARRASTACLIGRECKPRRSKILLGTPGTTAVERPFWTVAMASSWMPRTSGPRCPERCYNGCAFKDRGRA
jgi:hypothetical protein